MSADATGVYGGQSTLPAALSGTTNNPGLTGQRYVRLLLNLDDSTCGGTTMVSDVTVTYVVPPPAAPTLITPSSGFIGTTILPSFTLRTTTASPYAQYKIDVCSAADCSTIVRTIDQTASQTGWSGQDANASTAYATSTVLVSSTIATHTYQAAGLALSTQYWWRASAIDPSGSNSWSALSAIQSFTTQSTPAAPTLLSPGAGASGVSVSEPFTLKSTDADSDYLKYKIDVCITSNCSSILRTIDQTASQTGWILQNANAGTAYTSAPLITNSQTAGYIYQSPLLVPNTQYWWRAYAIDPGGTNTWSAVSGIQTFTTGTNAVRILGGTRILGGIHIGT